MNLAALRSEVAACRAWERALHAGSPETRKAAAMPGRWETLLPLVMPLYGAVGLSTGFEFKSEWWVVIWPWWLLLGFGRIFPRTTLTDWEALRLPSRRGWLLARWSLRLPWLVHLGLCTAAHHVLLGLRDVPDPDGLRWSILGSLLIAPLLIASLSAWLPLQQRAFGGRSWVAPLLALALAFGLLVLAGAIYLKKESDPGDVPAISGFLAAVAILIFILTLPSLASLNRGAARFSGGPGGPTLCLHGLVGMAGIGPATVLLIVWMFPGSVIVHSGSSMPAAWTGALLVLTVAGIVVVALQSLRLVASADVGIEPRPEAVAPKQDSSARPASAFSLPVRSGKGLRAAAWALYRGGWRNLQHPWLMFVPKVLWEFRGPVCAAGAVAIVSLGSTKGSGNGIVALWLGIVFLAIIPSHLRMPASHRLHLLGGNFSAVAIHNLRWGMFLAVIPAALAGALPFLLLGTREPPPFLALAGAWGGTVGFLLLKVGAGISPLIEFLSGGQFLLLLSCGLLGWYFDTPSTLGVAGTILFALALRSTVRDFRDPESAGRRFAEGATDD